MAENKKGIQKFINNAIENEFESIWRRTEILTSDGEEHLECRFAGLLMQYNEPFTLEQIRDEMNAGICQVKHFEIEQALQKLIKGGFIRKVENDKYITNF
jgi:hypothetical protein